LDIGSNRENYRLLDPALVEKIPLASRVMNQ
jgi:hypothetical protein